MTPQPTLNKYIAAAIADNSGRQALTDIDGQRFSYTYLQTAQAIARMHAAFELAGIKRGDHIAICAHNSSRWGVAFLAIVTYGAVAVSILPDFAPADIVKLTVHSDARVLLSDDKVWHNIEPHVSGLGSLLGVIALDSDMPLALYEPGNSTKISKALAGVARAVAKKYPAGINPSRLEYAEVKPDDVVMINYTSGSTGSPKGVMLTERNIWSNVQYSIDGLQFLKPGDATVCMLPLAHMFGLTVDLLHPFVKGCNINFVTRTPSPAVILSAFAKVKPKLVVSVPLVVDKIIRKKVFPMLETPKMKRLLGIPLVNSFVYRSIRKKLIDVFGGRLQEMIIGGAALSQDVERFLRKVKFPFTVGYGMTECGPLVGYAAWNEQQPGTCGHIVDRMEIRIDSPDPANIPGTIEVKGDNVMKGYYKNPEATGAVIKSDGWMDTGDIGTLNARGLISIRGRNKNMILGASGQNIYPEELEQLINNLEGMSESVVVDDDKGRLVALIHPDPEYVAQHQMNDEAVEKLIEENVRKVNQNLPAYSKIARHLTMKEEFLKTPKKSIRRYLYGADGLK